METLCKNCGHKTEDRFCPHCGQKTSTSRFTLGHLFHEFLHGFYHVDHGLLFTTKELALRPGGTVRNYLEGKRISYFNPFTFILLLGGINALLLKQLHWQNFFVDLGMLDPKAINQEIWNSSIEHFTIRLLLAIPIYSLATFCFYFKNRYTIAEHLIANTFIRGEICFFMILVEPVLFISHQPGYLVTVKFTLLLLLIIYMGWSYAGLFKDKYKKTDLLKGIFVALMASSLELITLSIIISKKLAEHLL